jgi:D-lyxose ketol-isomerase
VPATASTGSRERRKCWSGRFSAVNDDRTDNRVHEPVGRFTDIEKDEKPLHLLITDYPRYL